LGTGAFLAFKLHQFVSGAAETFTTLTEKPRNVLFEGSSKITDRADIGSIRPGSAGNVDMRSRRFQER